MKHSNDFLVTLVSYDCKEGTEWQKEQIIMSKMT